MVRVPSKLVPLTAVRPMTRGRPTMVAYGVWHNEVVLGYVDASLNNQET